ncbi:MAG: adenylyltransferase/cytidyltransferase family protein [Patescibacteria group bacterium]
MKKVMVFGVFDGVHDGHRAFLKEAKSHGDYLIAVLAQDHIVERLKGRLPEINLAERLEHLKKEDGVDEVVIGDAELGVWEVMAKYQPQVIAVGHDQQLLKEALEKHCAGGGLSFCPEIKLMSYYEINK